MGVENALGCLLKESQVLSGINVGRPAWSRFNRLMSDQLIVYITKVNGLRKELGVFKRNYSPNRSIDPEKVEIAFSVASIIGQAALPLRRFHFLPPSMHAITPNIKGCHDVGLYGQKFLPAFAHPTGGQIQFSQLNKGAVMTRFRNHEFPIKLL